MLSTKVNKKTFIYVMNQYAEENNMQKYDLESLYAIHKHQVELSDYRIMVLYVGGIYNSYKEYSRKGLIEFIDKKSDHSPTAEELEKLNSFQLSCSILFCLKIKEDFEDIPKEKLKGFIEELEENDIDIETFLNSDADYMSWYVSVSYTHLTLPTTPYV